LGHFDQFPPTSARVGYGFRKETIAGMRRNGREAVIPVIRMTAIERQGSTRCGRCRSRRIRLALYAIAIHPERSCLLRTLQHR
jgi:hypothetical protein